MRRVITSVVFALAASLLMLMPLDNLAQRTPTALAASGATFFAPPNYNFEAGPLQVGSGPANYDFASGGSGWTAFGTVTYSAGVATISGGAVLRSPTYALTSNLQSIKIRYKAGASASVSVKVGGVIYGTDNLSCVNCTTGDWVDKYIGVYTSAQGQNAQVELVQGGGTTVVDEVGTQWIQFQQWNGTTAGTTAQPKQGGSQFMEVRDAMFSSHFQLTENRLEFDYSFPLAGGNSLSVELYRASDNAFLSSKSLTGGSVGWTRVVWSWGTNYIGQTVYLRLYSAGSQPSWIDNLGVNSSETAARSDTKSQKAGEPFDTSSGEFTHSHTDISIPGVGLPLEFTRTYHSMAATSANLGYNWRHTYSTSLRVDSDNSVTVNYASGGAAYFQYSSGSYTPPAGVHDTLVHNGDGTYTLTTVAVVHYNFTSGGKLTSIVDRNGNTTSVHYDSNGFLSQVKDEVGGRTLTFTPDASGRITQVQDQLGRTVGFQYDGNGDLVQVTDVKAGLTTYTYSNHRMTSLTDSNNHLQNVSIYDGASRVVEQTDAVGGKTCAYYGTPPSYTSASCPGVTPTPSAGQTVIVDPRVNKTTYDFDTNFRTTAITDALGGVTSYAYDSANNRTCATDPNGNKTGFTFDSSGNTTAIIDAANTDANCGLKAGGVKWSLTYTAKNDIGLVTDPLGQQTDHIYDAAGNLTRLIRKDAGGALKSLTCFERDPATGRATALVESTNLVIDPCAGNKTQFGYDQSGNLTSMIVPRFSNEPNVDTDNDSLGLSAVQSGGHCDSGGGAVPRFRNCIENFVGTDPARACAATPAANDEPVDAMPVDFNDDQLINVTDRTLMVLAMKNFSSIPSVYNSRYDLNADDAVDVNDRTIVGLSIKASGGAQCSPTTAPPQVTFTYDLAGRLLTSTNELGHTTTYTYDAQNNLLTQRDNLNNTTTYTYDAKGNLQTVTDANSPPAVTQYAYDAADRLTLVTDALGHKTIYSYDPNGNRTTATDGNRQTVNNPELGTAQCGTAGTGNNVDDDGDGAIDDGCPSTIYTYDALNRLQSTTDALAHVATYTYDAASNLTQMVDPRGIKTVYTPDALNRQHQIQYYSSGMTLLATTTYDYDAAGNRTDMIDGTGTTSYGHDGLNRLTSVTYPGNNVVGYQYDAVGNVSQIIYPGTTGNVQYQYNADHTMSSVQQSWGSVGATTYAYNNAGNLANATLPNGAWTDYGYDNADRLTSVVNKQPGPTTMSTYTYTLDNVGNRIGMTGTGGPQTYTLDQLSRLTQATYPGPVTDNYTYDADGNRLTKNSTTYTNDAADELTAVGSTSYTYDANGNLATRGSDTFTFNYANQLAQTVIGGTTATSTYNGDGLRMSHTVGAATANYVWDVNRSVPEILQDGTNTYVYGLGRISSTDGSGVQTYDDADGLGSTSDLTNSSATKTDGYAYDAFGAATHSPGSSTQPFQFTGQQTDADSGLQYLRARYYDGSTGRFLGKDPVSGLPSKPSTQNPYAYALGNPVNFTDPTGRFSLFNTVLGLRPVFTCSLTAALGDFACIGDFLNAIDRYNTFVLDFAQRFANLDCVATAFDALALAVPELTPARFAWDYWIQAGLFGTSAVLSGASFDPKEGASVGNLTSGAGGALALTAFEAAKFGIVREGFREFGTKVGAVALTVDAVACLNRAFG